jgi:hypothetical protein
MPTEDIRAVLTPVDDRSAPTDAARRPDQCAGEQARVNRIWNAHVVFPSREMWSLPGKCGRQVFLGYAL